MPDLTPSDAIPVIGQSNVKGSVVETGGTDSTGLPLLLVELDGTDERIEAVVQDGSAAIPGSGNRAAYEVGDEVVVTRFSGPAAEGSFAVVRDRKSVV